MESTIEQFENFCISSALLSVLALILGLLSKIGSGLFSAVCSFVATLLNFPMSGIDLFISALGLTWIFIILGFVFMFIRWNDR